MSKKWLLDLYVGVGIMERKITNTNREYSPIMHNMYNCKDLVWFFRELELSENSGIKANGTFGIRMGYKL